MKITSINIYKDIFQELKRLCGVCVKGKGEDKKKEGDGRQKGGEKSEVRGGKKRERRGKSKGGRKRKKRKDREREKR